MGSNPGYLSTLTACLFRKKKYSVSFPTTFLRLLLFYFFQAAQEERSEATQKHQVLSIYFNQREAELQKQLGVQTQRLGEVEVDSESVSKKLNLLYDELESYKSQCKSLKQEMEEQVCIDLILDNI